MIPYQGQDWWHWLHHDFVSHVWRSQARILLLDSYVGAHPLGHAHLWSLGIHVWAIGAAGSCSLISRLVQRTIGWSRGVLRMIWISLRSGCLTRVYVTWFDDLLHISVLYFIILALAQIILSFHIVMEWIMNGKAVNSRSIICVYIRSILITS